MELTEIYMYDILVVGLQVQDQEPCWGYVPRGLSHGILASKRITSST